MFCKACGYRLGADEPFCPHCGVPVAGAKQPDAQPHTQAEPLPEMPKKPAAPEALFADAPADVPKAAPAPQETPQEPAAQSETPPEAAEAPAEPAAPAEPSDHPCHCGGKRMVYAVQPLCVL